MRKPRPPAERVPVHPTQFSLVAGDPAVREFQVRQEGSRILLRVTLHEDADPTATDRIADAVTQRLRALGVERPAVAANSVDSIERTAARKLRIVVPDRSDAYAAAAGGMF